MKGFALPFPVPRVPSILNLLFHSCQFSFGLRQDVLCTRPTIILSSPVSVVNGEALIALSDIVLFFVVVAESCPLGDLYLDVGNDVSYYSHRSHRAFLLNGCSSNLLR